MWRRIRVQSYEAGLHFRDGEFLEILGSSNRWMFDPMGKSQISVVSRRDPWLEHEKLDLIVKSGALKNQAVVVDLKDHERGLVWIDGRFSRILLPGLHAYWTGVRNVQVEVVDARNVQFEHKDLRAIAESPDASRALSVIWVEPDNASVLFINGQYAGSLAAGQYAFWHRTGDLNLVPLDLREKMVDVNGQEIMTSDKVSIRINAVVTYKVADARRAASAAEDIQQSLYRDVQMALRATVGSRELDDFLADKDAVSAEIEEQVRNRAAELGLKLVSVGIRDIILPGEMKELMNRVTEAKKAAEANLISRREETAAMRSQSNTAKVLADNPTLLRLRELETLEKIAAGGKLSVVLGEKGLADRVTNLL